MTEQEFLRIQEKLPSFKYNSMQYTDYDDVADYELLHESDSLILLCGYDKESRKYQYHWASNRAEDLLKEIHDKPNFRIGFVPKEWVSSLESAGLKVFAIWNDYFRLSLEDISVDKQLEFLKKEECQAASEVTLACRWQSRGFTGQTVEWMEDWIGSDADANSTTDTKNKAVLIHRNEKGKIVGILCTATYSHDSEKGPIVWVRELAVHPDYQGRGIARKLIYETLAYGKSKGATRAFLAADECNARAIKLYESCGFASKEENGEINMYKD